MAHLADLTKTADSLHTGPSYVGPSYVGRIAPSPTGAQHLGNARTYLVAWLLAKANSGRLLLRIEDLDTPRTKVGATEQIFEDLHWLGILWDSTDIAGSREQLHGHMDVENVRKLPGFVVQSDRVDRHRFVLEKLKEAELVYPCTCSRKEIEESSSAPHESPRSAAGEEAVSQPRIDHPLDGTVYPGFCSHRTAADAERLEQEGKKYAWRFRFAEGAYRWTDAFAGEQSLDPKSQLGDFVVARNYGPPAYQLAVVVDDHDSGVNQVVRGDDLIYSTYRQLAIYDALQWQPPSWFHVPLVVGDDGRRLAKRHGDTRLVSLKNAGMSNRELLGLLAHSLQLISEPHPIDLVELKTIVCADPGLLQRIPKRSVRIPLGPYSQLP